jgi:hypothetical protein
MARLLGGDGMSETEMGAETGDGSERWRRWPLRALRRHPPVRSFFVGLAIAYLGIGSYWISQAPAGWWVNRIFDYDMWLENDPGGWYIASAHELALRPGHTCFGGHPGTPLELVLYAEQLGMYRLSRLGNPSLDFTPFIARHLLSVWKVARLTMVLLHLASFLLLYEYTRLLTRQRALAVCAAAMYATSFPVLYFLTRVSPEPLVVVFFLGTVVCLVNAEDASFTQGRRAAWATLGGACAASAFFTKIHLMALWPLWAGVALFLGGTPGIPLPQRVRTTVAYATGGAVPAFLYARLVNWRAFGALWARGGTSSLSLSAEERSAVPESLSEFLSSLASTVGGNAQQAHRQAGWQDFLPAATQSRGFFFFEFLFGLAFAAGVLCWLRRRERSPRWLGWAAVYGGSTVLVWLYRAGRADFHGFHYLFPAMAAAAPFAAYGVGVLLPGMLDGARPWPRRSVELGAALVALHASGFFAVLDSRLQDRQGFAARRAPYYWAALERLAPGERVALLGGGPFPFHGLSDSYALAGEGSALIRELEDTFLTEPPRADRDPDRFERRVKRHRLGVVLDFRMTEPGPWSPSEWKARAAARRE